jgi:hypothetical protein
MYKARVQDAPKSNLIIKKTKKYMTTPKPKKAPAKKASPKEAAPKKAAPKKAALTAKPPATLKTATVHYDVNFFGGTGEIDLEGAGIDETFTKDGGFDVSQSVGGQITTVTGFTGGSGEHIDVTVTEDGSQIGSGSFSGNTINSDIRYTVK